MPDCHPPAALPSPTKLLVALLDDQPDLSLLSDPIRWETIKANAARHGVAQLVAGAARPHVSGADRVWCDQILTRSWTRHTANLNDAWQAVTTLRPVGIEPVVLKGALQARRHYSPPFLRKPSGDIDLAVRTSDLQKACKAFAAQGYVVDGSLRESLSRSHHIELHHPSRPHVELHFRLSHGAYGIPVNEFMDRATEQDVPGLGTVRVPEPADELFHLILHRAHGRFATLFHLLEIRRIWRAATADTRNRALALAKKHHFTGCFWLTDLAFRHYWNEPLMEPVSVPETWLKSRLTPDFYERFEALSDPGRTLPLSVRLRRRWIDFQLTDSPADALRFLKVMARVSAWQLTSGGWRTVEVK